MKGITAHEKREWSRAKVLATSKRRFDSLGIRISDPQIYLHMKRMFLHCNNYELISFNIVKEGQIKNILNNLNIEYTKIEDRLVLNMAKWYVGYQL